MQVALIVLLGQGVGLHQAAESLLLELLLHLYLAKIEPKLISTFNLSACLFNDLLNLLNSFNILVRSTGQHISEDVCQLVIFLSLSEKILIKRH